MKLPKLNMTKQTKHTVLGGIVGSLAVQLESASSYFVAGYPQILKDKLNPSVPRNGALVANLAPAGYAVYRKHRGHSDVKNGILLYDLPKLVDQFAYNIAYHMGLPSQRFSTITSTGQPVLLRANSVRATIPPVMVGTRYAIVSSVATNRPAGIGKYR